MRKGCVARGPVHAEALLFLGRSDSKVQVHRGPVPENPRRPRFDIFSVRDKPLDGKAMVDLDKLLLKIGKLCDGFCFAHVMHPQKHCSACRQ